MPHARRPLLLLCRDPKQRFASKRALASGFDVDAVATIEEAAIAVRESRPDLALLDDVTEGRMLAFVAWLGAFSPRTMTIALSWPSMSRACVAASRAGVADFLDTELDAAAVERSYDEWKRSLPPLDFVSWTHVHRVVAAHGDNVSAAARQLGCTRQGLAKMVERTPPKSALDRALEQ